MIAVTAGGSRRQIAFDNEGSEARAKNTIDNLQPHWACPNSGVAKANGSDPVVTEEKMANSSIVNVTDASFASDVLESGEPVLLQFWAGWCGPCRAIAPIVEEIASAYQGRLKVCRMDVDRDAATPTSYKISGIPTLLLLRRGEVVEQLVGYRSMDDIQKMIEKHISAASVGIGYRGSMPPEIVDLYRQMAARSAHALPESVDGALLTAWCALARSDSLLVQPVSVERFAQRHERLWADIKRKLEAAEINGHIDVDLDQNLIPNIAFLLLANAGMTFAKAVDEYARSISSGLKAVASEEDLRSAVDHICVVLAEWCRTLGIYVTSRESLNIPASTIKRLLRGCEGQPDLHFAPVIPPEKLANACWTCSVPQIDLVAALIDCTFWGSAKNAVVIGTRGVYYHNLDCLGHIPYCDFPYLTFTMVPGQAVVSCGEGRHISVSGSQVPAERLVYMLDVLKKEARRLQSRSQVESGGLTSIPGMHSLKRMLQEEVIEPLQNPEKFRKYRIDIPNGILLFGPPGCGKTFIARKLAEELNREFIEVSPATVGSPYVHESGLKIAALFERAARSAPSIMFVDEFDGLVPSRVSMSGDAQYKAEEVNEWLVQIGNCADRRILFVAATNQPWKIDEAVRRSGRLDKKVYVGPPDRTAIAEILEFHLQDRPVSPELKIEAFSEAIEGNGYSASDLKLIVDEASKLAMKEEEPIRYHHLESVAAQKVFPSVSQDQEEDYQSFMANGPLG